MGDVGENYRISDIDFSAQSLAYVDVAVCTEKVCDMVLKNFLLMNIWLHLVHVYYKNIFIDILTTSSHTHKLIFHIFNLKKFYKILGDLD